MNKGFTLIELLVVVLIIGILSAVALPQYQKSVGKARATEAIQAAKAWGKAQGIYYLETGRHAHDWNELSISMPSTKYFSVENRYGSAIRFWPNYSLGSYVNYLEFRVSGEGSLYGSCSGDYATCKNIMPCNEVSCSL